MANARLRQLEDVADEAIHGCALVLSLLALLFLSENSPRQVGVFESASPALFGATMLLVFAASSMNRRSQGHRTGPVFQAIDHCAIFLLIAGTYTPVSLLAFGAGAGWDLFATVWTMAMAGIALRVFWARGFSRVALALYLGTGWIGALWASEFGVWMGTFGGWLLAGGVAYTLGVVFFASRLPFGNAIWHLFVVVGSACHFCAVAFYILPLRA